MQLFSPFGTIQDCRLLHSGDGSRGVGALVRMSSIEEATRAIEALNNRVPTGTCPPTLVHATAIQYLSDLKKQYPCGQYQISPTQDALQLPLSTEILRFVLLDVICQACSGIASPDKQLGSQLSHLLCFAPVSCAE